MTKKQVAVGLAGVLTALATALSQCKDDSPLLPRTGVTVGADAGVR